MNDDYIITNYKKSNITDHNRNSYKLEPILIKQNKFFKNRNSNDEGCYPLFLIKTTNLEEINKINKCPDIELRLFMVSILINNSQILGSNREEDFYNLNNTENEKFIQENTP